MIGLINRLMRRIQFLLLGILVLEVLNAQQQNLDYFIKQGLQNSPLLKDYQNRLRSGQIDSLRLKATLGFQINATSMNSYAPVINGWGYDEVKTDIANVSALAGITRDIIGNNNIRNKYQALHLQSQSTSIEGNLSEKDLKKSIISQYILAYGDLQQHLLNSDVLDVLRQEEQLAKKLAEEGVYKQTEYLSLLVGLRQQEIVTLQSGIQYKADLELLNAMCGIYDTVCIELSDPGIAVSTPSALHNTPFYRQFETDSMKLINADRQINFDYRPKLSLYADGGYYSSLSYMPGKNFGMSAGLSLTMPIYDGGQRKMQHDQIAISEDTRKDYRNFFVSQYRQQIAMLTRQLAYHDPLISQCTEQLAYAQTLIDANRLLLRTGDISITDYLLAVRFFLNAKNLLIENRLTRYRIINEINYWSQQ
jgi:outer membrane protein TolC